jgi:hypothetical protein
MKLKKINASLCLMLIPLAFATATETNKSSIFVDYIQFEDHIYSQSKKSEVGDQTELDMAFKFQYNESTYGRLRFETDPSETSTDNKTSKFEALLNHKYETLEFQADLDLKTNDGSSGGTSIGQDTDSEGTYIAWEPMSNLKFTFFPYNFDGEVGSEFNTLDVTRINYIDGAPTTVNNTVLSDESIVQKTIPGLQVDYSPMENLSLYVGFGFATYLHPTNDDFDIENNPSVSSWERREDTGYKLGFSFELKDMLTLEGSYVGHNKSEETGSLLASAGSLEAKVNLGQFILVSEYTMSKAGTKPWRIERSGSWFEEQTPFQPIYEDTLSVKQDWIGQTDSAYMLKAGYQLNQITPYVAYKYQGKHFIYKDRESAHTLRTAEETLSHGGLHRLGLGAFIKKGKFTIQPDLEYMKAKNPVFNNSSDVRSDKILASFKKTDYLISLEIGYSFDGYSSF